MQCVRCAQPIDPSTVIGQLAECSACGQVFDVVEAARSYVPPSPPAGVSVHPLAGGVALELAWGQDINALGIALQLLFAAMPIAVGWNSWRLMVLAVPNAGFLVYNLVTNLVNRTTIVLGPGAVSVSHGPLPTMWNRTGVYPLARLRGLRVTEVVWASVRGRPTTKHQLEAPGSGGPLLKDWNTPAPLEYVRDVLLSAAAALPVTGREGAS